MVRRLFGVGIALVALIANTGCNILVAGAAYTVSSVASARIIDYERSEEKSKLLIGHVPIVTEIGEEEADVSILTILRAQREGDSVYRNGFFETLLLSVYRGEVETGESAKYAFLEFTLLAMTLKRHWSFFRYVEDQKSTSIGFLYFFDFKDAKKASSEKSGAKAL